MIFSFKKGRHWARPFYWLHWWPLLINTQRICRRVKFSFDSKYELPAADQLDTNKLFGISFAINRHKNSARFGWCYVPERNTFKLSAYCYIGGQRGITDLCECTPNHYYECRIEILPHSYVFEVFKSESGEKIAMMLLYRGKERKIGWLCGPFFGGNNPAPKNLKLELKKIH